MKAIAKKLVAGLVGMGMMALGLVWMGTGKAHAYSDSIQGDNTAQITITITPNVNRFVTITTDNVNMNLGAVQLGPTASIVSTQTVRPATVTVGGTFGNTDLLLSANITSGGTAWSFDASSTSAESDSLATWVSFTSISSATAPTQDGVEYFTGQTNAGTSHMLASGAQTFAATRVGSGGTPGRFENLSTNLNNMAINDQRHMWMYFRMPSGTTSTNDQLITFVLTVDSGL